MTHRPMTDRVHAFAVEAMRETVKALLDDPSDLLDLDAEQTPEEVLRFYRAVCSDLSLHFNQICEELGTPAERLRLRQIEAGTYRPERGASSWPERSS